MGMAFESVLNMSFTASILVAAIVILRLVFPRMPKRFLCIMWALVAVRLVCPFSISSNLSAYNLLHFGAVKQGTMRYVSLNRNYEEEEKQYKGELVKSQDLEKMEALDNPNVDETVEPVDDVLLTKVRGQKELLVLAWIAGVVGMLLFAASKYYMVHIMTKASIKRYDNIFVSDDIDAPFVLGIFSPKVYIPSRLGSKVEESVIRHERAHIRRRDNLWKPLAYAVLSIHWFNPVVWLAFSLLCKDIEAACDERVICNMNKEQVAEYSEALLFCATHRYGVSACQVAFGETSVKRRVKDVLKYKKPGFLRAAGAVIVCAFLAVGFLTNPFDSHSEGIIELSKINPEKFYLTIGDEGVEKIVVTNRGIVRTEEEVDPSLLEKGDVYCIEELYNYKSLSDVTIAAYGKNEKIIWKMSFPDDYPAVDYNASFCEKDGWTLYVPRYVMREVSVITYPADYYEREDETAVSYVTELLEPKEAVKWREKHNLKYISEP